MFIPSQRYMELLELNKQFNLGSKPFSGDSLPSEICDIGMLLRDSNSKTVLDYGCGTGVIQEYFHVDKLWQVEYTGYDPTVEKFNELPNKIFDAVICTDVLEHIPEEDLDMVMTIICSHAKKFIFIKVPTYEVDEFLPDGQNVHCTIKPKEWWEDLFHKYIKLYEIPIAYKIKCSKPEGDQLKETILSELIRNNV